MSYLISNNRILGSFARLCCAVMFILVASAPLFAQEKSAKASASTKVGPAIAIKDLNGHFPFTPPASLEQWNRRAEEVRQQLRVSLGLWPMPKLEPVRPSLYGKMTLDGYTIEKVTFESLPGLYVTGNLYRPTNPPEGKKLPAVLCPHGHWANARFYDEKPQEVKKLLATGAERFEMAARNHIQARCVQLARMDCVVFHWDMLGYCDSTQISFERAHRFASQPKESEVKDDGWLLFSPLAESHGQSIMGLQALAALRGIDFVTSLPDVDTSRIAITGASGGGTQTFITAAIDPRIAVAFPAVMVSTGMQGGCTCENCSWLRVGTGNIEIAGLVAPRPLGMTAANDWTKTMPEDGFPQLQQLYGLFGAKDKVALFPSIHFGHNYNHVARTSMYGWINKHLKLGFEEPVLEREFDLKLRNDLTVWDAEHPQPPGGEAFERQLMKRWSENIDAQFSSWLNGSQGDRKRLAEVLSTGWKVCLGLTTAPPQIESPDSGIDSAEWSFHGAAEGSWKVKQMTKQSDQAPKAVALWLEASDSIGPDAIQELADAGVAVYTIASADLAGKEQPLVSNPRLAAAYTFGYNMPTFARKVRQVGATLGWLQGREGNARIAVVGQDADAALAAGGIFAAQHWREASKDPANSTVTLVIKDSGFRFSKIDSIRDPNFAPGASRFWDLPGLVGNCSGQVLLSVAGSDTPWNEAGKLLQNSGNNLVLETEDSARPLAKKVVDWSKAL